MLNNVVLVGRVVMEPELTVHESGARSSKLLLSVVRPFRNENNEYESDLIPIYVWYKMADIVCEYVGTGSIIGCKCRLGTHKIDVEGMRLNLIDVIAERISFIQLKDRVNKSHAETEEEIIAKEMEKNKMIDLDLDDLKDKDDNVVFNDIDEAINYDDIKNISDGKVNKNKSKAK